MRREQRVPLVEEDRRVRDVDVHPVEVAGIDAGPLADHGVHAPFGCAPPSERDGIAVEDHGGRRDGQVTEVGLVRVVEQRREAEDRTAALALGVLGDVHAVLGHGVVAEHVAVVAALVAQRARDLLGVHVVGTRVEQVEVTTAGGVRHGGVGDHASSRNRRISRSPAVLSRASRADTT